MSKRFFNINPDVQNRIYAEFDEMFTIIPHYPKYSYINAVMDNSWAGKLKRWQANMIFESWKESRRALSKLWRGIKNENL